MEPPRAEHKAEQTAHHVHHGRTTRISAGAVRTSAEDRATLPGAGADAPTDRDAGEDPRNRHTIRPRRAEMLTGCRSHRRSHSPRSRHKTRRALYRCISEQIPTAGANAPQNAIHGAGANRANLPRWTEAHRTTAEHTRSHTEPFLSILRTFTHRQINHAQNVKIALIPTKQIGESIQSIMERRTAHRQSRRS